MLEGKEIDQKLQELADKFQQHMRNKQWAAAKACYDNARTVAVFLEMDEKKKQELFGERREGGEIILQGAFPEYQVQKAYLECIKRNQTYENKGYEPLQKNSA